MSRALFTGVSGLRAHQQQLDVVANNIANMNTTGFKSQYATFRDRVYDNLRSSSSPSDNVGGINPLQVGTGAEVGQISRTFTQGALNSTGEELDFGIQGDGFFVVKNSSGENIFTRAGSFSLDAEGRLVDPSTGFLVQRTGAYGESTDDDFGFQVEGDSRIQIPLGSALPAEPTTQIDLTGNLPAGASPAVQEVLSTTSAFEDASGPATGATLLDDLTISQTPYGAGDLIELNGTNPDGTSFSVSVDAENATLQDIIDALNGTLSGATAAISPNGVLSITADETGEAFISLTIRDNTGNVGGSDFVRNTLLIDTEGTNGDTYDLSMEVFDKRGLAHRVTLEFTKTSVNRWDLSASLEDSSGELLDGEVEGILFNEDGTFSIAGEEDDEGTTLEFKFDSIEESQVVELDFSSLNHFASNFTLAQNQDGTPPGTLVSVAVSGTVEVTGLTSNGNSIPLAQLAIASVRKRWWT